MGVIYPGRRSPGTARYALGRAILAFQAKVLPGRQETPNQHLRCTSLLIALDNAPFFAGMWKIAYNL